MRSGPNSQKLDRNDIIDFFQSEGQIRYDSIVQDDLAVDDNFNETAYKEFLKIADINEVLPRNDMVYQHATVVCGLYKATNKAYVLDAKEFSHGIARNIDEAVIFLKRNLKLSYKIKEV